MRWRPLLLQVIALNVGVELGQLEVIASVLLAVGAWWRIERLSGG